MRILRLGAHKFPAHGHRVGNWQDWPKSRSVYMKASLLDLCYILLYKFQSSFYSGEQMYINFFTCLFKLYLYLQSPLFLIQIFCLVITRKTQSYSSIVCYFRFEVIQRHPFNAMLRRLLCKWWRDAYFMTWIHLGGLLLSIHRTLQLFSTTLVPVPF